MESRENIFLKIYETIKVVKGVKRNIICNLQNNTFLFIDDRLFFFVEMCNKSSLSSIESYFGNNEISIFTSFLIQKDFAFFCSHEELVKFPKVNTIIRPPNVVDHAIVDFCKDTKHPMSEIIAQLNSLKCKFIQFRFYSEINSIELNKILILLSTTSIVGTEVVIKFTDELDELSILNLFVNNSRLTNLTIHSSPSDLFLQSDTPRANIIYTTHKLLDEGCCGIINQYYFSINNKLFTESLEFNTCLNRKISIDSKGLIKNCPSMRESFGNINDTTLMQVIEEARFKDVWYIKKDQIEVCKDCEFRHICTDCRAYIQDPNDIYSKPSKCSYDPYSGKWDNENRTNNSLFGR